MAYFQDKYRDYQRDYNRRLLQQSVTKSLEPVKPLVAPSNDPFGEIADVYRKSTGWFAPIQKAVSVPWDTIMAGFRRSEPSYALDMLFGPAQGAMHLAKEYVWDPIRTTGAVGQQVLADTTEALTGKRSPYPTVLEKDYQKAVLEGREQEFRNETLWDAATAFPTAKSLFGAAQGAKALVQGGTKMFAKEGIKGAFKSTAFKDVGTPASDLVSKFKLPESFPIFKFTGAKFTNPTIIKPLAKVTGKALWALEKGFGKVASMPFNKAVTDPLWRKGMETAILSEFGIRSGDIFGMGRGGTDEQREYAKMAAQAIPDNSARLIQSNPAVNALLDIGVGGLVGVPYMEKLSGWAMKAKKYLSGVDVATIDRFIDSAYDSKLVDDYGARKAMQAYYYGLLGETKRPVTPDTLSDVLRALEKGEETITLDDIPYGDLGVYRDAATGKAFSREQRTKHFLNFVYDNVQGKMNASDVDDVFTKMSNRLKKQVGTPSIVDEQYKYLKAKPDQYAMGRVRRVPTDLGIEPSAVQKKLAELRENPMVTYFTGSRSESEIYNDILDDFRRKLASSPQFKDNVDDIITETESVYRREPKARIGDINLLSQATLQDLFIGDWKTVIAKTKLGGLDNADDIAKELGGLARKSFADMSAKYVGMKPWMMNQAKAGKAGEALVKGTVTGRTGRFTGRLGFHMQQIFEDLPYIAMDAMNISDPTVQKAFTSVGGQSFSDISWDDITEVEKIAHAGLTALGGVEDSANVGTRLHYESAKRAKAFMTRWVSEFSDALGDMPAIKKIMAKNGYKTVSEIPEYADMLADIQKNPKKVIELISKFRLGKIDDTTKTITALAEGSPAGDVNRIIKESIDDVIGTIVDGRATAKTYSGMTIAQKNGKLVNEFATSRIDDIARKLDISYPTTGTGTRFKKLVGSKGVTLDDLRGAAKKAVDQIGKSSFPQLTDRGIRWTGDDVVDALFEANRRAIRTAKDSAKPYYLYANRASGFERDLHSVLFPYRYTKKVVSQAGRWATSGSALRPISLKKMWTAHDQYLKDLKDNNPEEFDQLYGWGETDNIPEYAFKHMLEVVYSAMPTDLRYGSFTLGGPQPMINAIVQFVVDSKDVLSGEKVKERGDPEYFSGAVYDGVANLLDKTTIDQYKLEVPIKNFIKNFLRKYSPRP